MDVGRSELLYTISTAARELGRCEGWVRGRVDSGELRGFRDAIGRRLIPSSEIERVRGDLSRQHTEGI